ncbi:MAG: hypothetical protein K6G87_04905 [Butyrivibrio sp.]|uniref:hypothetical protein n=1 Tax=Butyrivibrio sp. TaxID=28121 RepID=UPI0025FA8A7C|nr:hypothetical protein [Butyrivibrio sp.]MCR5770560.1 hypothetical protein [Butyrivibrio sp.]
MLTIKELMPGLKHYRQEPIGKILSRNGKTVNEYKGFEYYETPQGLMRMDVWHSEMIKAIRNEGKGSLLEAIINHCRLNCAWLKEDELEEYACHCLARESYKAWSDFVIGEQQ